MASAGRILIMPKGNYNSSATYEMLDLVFHNGTSWVAKKTAIGIEPSDANNEFWHKLCESVDLTEIQNRIAALESQMLNAISLDDIDLSAYATKVEVAKVNTEVDALEKSVNGLSSQVTNLNNTVNTLPTSNLKLATGSYVGTGKYGTNDKTSITFDFVPKVVFISTESPVYPVAVTWVYGITKTSMKPNNSGDAAVGIFFELSGNTLSWYGLNGASWQLNNVERYYWVAIG